MPLIYYDKYVIVSKEDRHPGFTLDLNHPCVSWETVFPLDKIARIGDL